MARLRGERKRILDEAEERMAKALDALDQLRAKVLVAEAEWRAHAANFYALQKSLAPKPSKPTAGTTAAPKRVYERCTRCDKTKGHRFHKDSSDADYHPFQPAQPAARPSSPSNGAESSIASSETQMEGAPDVVRASVGDGNE